VSVFLSARAASYHARGRALVDAATLDIVLGRVTIVIGPNGAGKSTLLKLFSGELSPSGGEISCDGAAVRSLSPWFLACRRAIMTQSAQLSFPFLCYEVVRLGLEGIGKSHSRRQSEDLVAQCLSAGGVLHLASRRYETLSGGEQRRVQFARALAQLEAGRSISERQALLLDEPVANLDLHHQFILLDAARSAAARGVAVLVVLHDLNLAARYADTLAIMRNGALVACGTPAAVLSGETLSDVFDVDLTVTASPSGNGVFVTPSRWIDGDSTYRNENLADAGGWSPAPSSEKTPR
jgi:iron complex transport system ATP-binding protein